MLHFHFFKRWCRHQSSSNLLRQPFLNTKENANPTSDLQPLFLIGRGGTKREKQESLNLVAHGFDVLFRLKNFHLWYTPSSNSLKQLFSNTKE